MRWPAGRSILRAGVVGACLVRRPAGQRKRSVASRQLVRLPCDSGRQGRSQARPVQSSQWPQQPVFFRSMGGSLANRISATGDCCSRCSRPCCLISLRYAPISSPLWRCWPRWSGTGRGPLRFRVAGGGHAGPAQPRGMPRHRLHADRAAEARRRAGGRAVQYLGCQGVWRARASAAASSACSRSRKSSHRDSLMYVERMRVLHDLGLG